MPPKKQNIRKRRLLDGQRKPTERLFFFLLLSLNYRTNSKHLNSTVNLRLIFRGENVTRCLPPLLYQRKDDRHKNNIFYPRAFINSLIYIDVLVYLYVFAIFLYFFCSNNIKVSKTKNATLTVHFERFVIFIYVVCFDGWHCINTYLNFIAD